MSNVDPDIKLLIDKLELQRGEIIESLKVSIKAQAESWMRGAVSRNPEKVSSLGVEGLKPIKEKFNYLLASLDSECETILQDDSIWCYGEEFLDEDCSPSFFMSGNRVPDPLSNAVKKLFHPLGSLLLEYDLDDTDTWSREGGIVKYRYAAPIDGEPLALIKDFSKTHEVYQKKLREIQDANKKLVKKDALNLWDEA
ncbi:hypothetical protein [Pseudoalteromonas rhizosphaerae]|uniref:hypothetical protein n=1 Tax=Pseudoalteromonas rhizosphaerae TaxID=2518973 RepID=UPI002148D538|nr:hypothetical protein [Pseudoalteromonas rhizosphaerae]